MGMELASGCGRLGLSRALLAGGAASPERRSCEASVMIELPVSLEAVSTSVLCCTSNLPWCSIGQLTLRL